MRGPLPAVPMSAVARCHATAGLCSRKRSGHQPDRKLFRRD